eukprot:maker-scaffold_142-snap-gene-0.9-mRNA-1 protein AED:0.48 eAED:0.90 QI:0/0/0/1/0/0/2/0/61
MSTAMSEIYTKDDANRFAVLITSANRTGVKQKRDFCNAVMLLFRLRHPLPQSVAQSSRILT